MIPGNSYLSFYVPESFGGPGFTSSREANYFFYISLVANQENGLLYLAAFLHLWCFVSIIYMVIIKQGHKHRRELGHRQKISLKNAKKVLKNSKN
jgi:hypothetical protein